MVVYLSSKLGKIEFVILTRTTWIQIHHFQNEKEIYTWSPNSAEAQKE